MSKGPLLLAGSGEFTDAMIDVDRFFLRTIKNPVVAIVPTAAGQEPDWWKWAENGVAHYKKLDIPAFGVRLQTKEDANLPSIIDELNSANVYYFSGGDPRYVLSVINNSAAWKTIYSRFQNGSALAGSSAGAMFLGSWIPSNIKESLEHGKRATWIKALNLVPYIIWPHFDWGFRMFGNKITTLMEEGQKKSPWLGIDEDTAVIWKSTDKPLVMGQGKAHTG